MVIVTQVNSAISKTVFLQATKTSNKMVFVFYGGTYRLVLQKSGIPKKVEDRKEGWHERRKGGREKGKKRGGTKRKKKNTS